MLITPYHTFILPGFAYLWIRPFGPFQFTVYSEAVKVWNQL